MSRTIAKIRRNIRDIREMWDGSSKLPWYKRIVETIYLSAAMNPIYNLYIDLIIVPYERIKRICYYIPVLWRIGDWDHSWHTRLFAHSLKRLYKNMDEGHCTFPEKKKRRMKTAINILERMSNDWEAYVDAHHDYITKNYGEIPSIFDKEEDRWSGKGIQKKLYYSLVVMRDDEMFKQEFDLLAKILKKDLRGWWD